MSQVDTKDAIMRTLRKTNEPALSAQSLADEIDVSVHTINNHVENLVNEDSVETTQIGNATAYYIPFSDLPPHKKPDHICARCGRETPSHQDHAKIEYDRVFDGENFESGTARFYIFCRFCFSDFIGWVMDPATIGDYRGVHSWYIPRDQLREVQDDPDTPTKPNIEYLDDTKAELVRYIEGHEGDDGVPDTDVEQRAEELGVNPRIVDKVLRDLRRGGYIYYGRYSRYRAAK